MQNLMDVRMNAREAALAAREAAVAAREAAVDAKEAEVAMRNAATAFFEAEQGTHANAALPNTGPGKAAPDGHQLYVHFDHIEETAARQNIGTGYAGSVGPPLNSQQRQWLMHWAPMLKKYRPDPRVHCEYLALLVHQAGGLFANLPSAAVADAADFNREVYESACTELMSQPERRQNVDVPPWCLWMQLRQRNPDGHYANRGQRFLVSQLARVLKAVVDESYVDAGTQRTTGQARFMTEPYIWQCGTTPMLPDISLEEWMRRLIEFLERQNWIRRTNPCAWENDPERFDPCGYEPGCSPVLLPSDPVPLSPVRSEVPGQVA